MNDRLVAPVLAVLLAVAGLAPAQDLAPIEVAGLNKAAEQWVKLGKWAAARKLGEQARACADRAARTDAKAKGLTKLQGQAEDCADGAIPSHQRQWEKKRASAGKKVAKILASVLRSQPPKAKPDVKARFDGYLLLLVEADGSDASWKQVIARVDEGEGGADLATKALEREPPEKWKEALLALVDRASAKASVVRKATEHPIRYYFSLPEGYDPQAERRWPVLVCVDGAGSGFRGIAEGYRKRRGELPLIIVSPCTFANTNAIEGKKREKYKTWYTDEVIDQGNKERLTWDLAGVLAILADLRRDYQAEERVYITGFSGGGNLTYGMIFEHPERVEAAAPACANFGRPGYAGLKGKASAEDVALPVHVITGAEDPHKIWTHGKEGGVPGIEPQTDAAMRVFKELGYGNVKRELVPGLKHSAAAERVLDTFRPFIEGKRKRGDSWD